MNEHLNNLLVYFGLLMATFSAGVDAFRNKQKKFGVVILLGQLAFCIAMVYEFVILISTIV